MPLLNKETASSIQRKGGSGIRLEFFFFFSPLMTIQLKLFLPSQSRTGQTEPGEAVGGQHPAPIVLRGAELGCSPHRNQPLPQSPPPPQILLRPSQQSPPITCLKDPLPSWRAVGVTWTGTPEPVFLVIVKNTVHNTSACSSHLHVQPRLHIHGKRFAGALCNLCASRSP